jgi:hypothetical protein
LPGALAFDRHATRLAVSGGPESGQLVVTVFDFPAVSARSSYTPPGTRTRCVLYLPDDRLVAANARNVYVFPPDGANRSSYLAGTRGR